MSNTESTIRAAVKTSADTDTIVNVTIEHEDAASAMLALKTLAAKDGLDLDCCDMGEDAYSWVKPGDGVADVWAYDADAAEGEMVWRLHITPDITSLASATIAKLIGARFNGDGQQREDADGTHICDVCAEVEGVEVNQMWDHETTRYDFSDGSSILVSGGAWDYGIPGSSPACACWLGADHGRHADECVDAGE